MTDRIKELLVAMVIYFVTVSVLLMAVYRFLENWHLSEFNFFVAGILVFLVALGWGYVLTALIFAPKKQMEETLTTLTNNILHELNIPLSTIQANSSMLKKNLTDPKALKRLQRIDDASLRLKKLYDELVYTIRKEMHTVEKEFVVLETLIEERIAVFQDQQRNPFILKLKQYTIEIDKIGFEQMFDNLVSNAMKYSSKDDPITIKLEDNTLCVKDQGIGMSATEILRLHERYYQADESKEGEGIGFALVKAYCDSEGFQIRIDSEPHKGTAIFIVMG